MSDYNPEIPVWIPTSETRAKRIYEEMFRTCFEYMAGVSISGSILEFGCWQGFTSKTIAELMNEFEFRGKLYLYDSFEGLPEIRSEIDQSSYECSMGWKEGRMALSHEVIEGIRSMHLELLGKGKFEIVPGFFDETLPEALPNQKVAMVHIDCDLYESTRTVLDNLLKLELFQDGSIILFDDYNCNRANPNMGERRALREAFEEQSRYAYSPFMPYGWHGHSFFVHDNAAG